MSANVFYRRDTVDVALHEVPAEPVAKAHRALEVDSPTHTPVADRRTLERRRDGGDSEPVRPELANRQTSAIHRNAFPFDDVRVAARDAELAPSIGFGNLCDRAEIVDQTGEHGTSWSA
jgi:hypothetical protein